MRKLLFWATILVAFGLAGQAGAATQQALVKKKQLAAELAPNPHKAGKHGCGDFLHCLFGEPRHGGVVQASARDVADSQTGEDIAWGDADKYAAGSIVVRTPERRLYYILGGGEARVYKVGVGREGFQWSGDSQIVAKAEWPTWHPPQQMIEREAAKGHMLPDEMEGGPDNPLGARAMYIGGTMFRIHGTNNAASIGGAVSSGCIRMMNADVIELYDRVKIGARVYVIQ